MDIGTVPTVWNVLFMLLCIILLFIIFFFFCLYFSYFLFLYLPPFLAIYPTIWGYFLSGNKCLLKTIIFILKDIYNRGKEGGIEAETLLAMQRIKYLSISITPPRFTSQDNNWCLII